MPFANVDHDLSPLSFFVFKEHIALLGMALTSPIEEGHEIARHLADYVLVWAGGGGDDVAKSPHLARIANSVYREHCPDDPTSRDFGFLGRSSHSQNLSLLGWPKYL